MDHLGAVVEVRIVVVVIVWVHNMGWDIVVQVSGVVVIVVVSMVISEVELVVVWRVVMAVMEVMVVVSIDDWVVNIGQPVIWVVLDSVSVVVVHGVRWVVLKLIIVAVVGSVVAISTSVDVVVVTVVLTGEVSVVTQVWLMSLQVPVSSIEVSEGVGVISVEWNGVVWVLVGLVLIWSQIVVWNIPSGVHIISVVGADWVVEWGTVVLSTEWIVGVVVLLSMDIMVSSEVLSVLLSLWLLALWLWLSLLLFLWLGWLLVLHEVKVVRVSISVRVWSISRVVPWVSIVATISWEGTVVSSSWISEVTISMWVWVLTVEVVGLLLIVGEGVWWGSVSVVEVVLVSLVDHAVLLVGWLGHDWEDVGWGPHVSSVQFRVEIWLHLEDKVSIQDIGLSGTEGSAVGIKGGVIRFVPSVGVEGVEVILPVEIKSLSLGVVGVGLNVVVHHIPWHVLVIEAFAPRVEGWGPEVHHDRLTLVHVFDSWVLSSDSSDLLSIERPGDVVWSPGHLVDVPLVLWIKAAVVVMGLALAVAISVDDVH